ncbi:MAG: HNH/endonuclease VII fold putative polymorphic toxin, partial [Colwellia sp.]
TRLGITKRQAMRQSKRDAGVPTSQQSGPGDTTTPNMTDLNQKNILGDNGLPIKTKEYTHTNGAGDKIVIQDHQAGHKFPDGGAEGAHFNVRPASDTRHGKVPGTEAHYPFDTGND